jgi:hypothetical protein
LNGDWCARFLTLRRRAAAREHERCAGQQAR